MKTEISFTENMRELIELGRKTQTRRPIKDWALEALQINVGHDAYAQSKGGDLPAVDDLGYDWVDGELRMWCAEYPEEGYVVAECPYGKKGVILKIKDSDLCLEITHIRIERVQDISEGDCLKEGIGSRITRDCKVPKFIQLWDSIYLGSEFNWDKNPWVWVLEFNVREGVVA
ncbi:hypothetical protein BEN74_18695 [Acinetobacter sp. WCHAc010034]|uniref:hypothetical protein n=1 Tax=Acinetobacter sp. WCHAc010034 TaxID=1879049 RepID=UPI000A39DBF5|nr:hypothetical protein [Acinetobacter sp. WCHAc010034]AYA04613.1 hypothetical protein BEN74_18695 [Acinetobacter sp. WCHAc010034]